MMINSNITCFDCENRYIGLGQLSYAYLGIADGFCFA